MSGKRPRREISGEEIEQIKLHWLAGHTETYIANIFDRHRWVIRRLMLDAGMPATRIVQLQRSQEWLKARGVTHGQRTGTDTL